MPRKAMKELGFQGCCLRCDAPDHGGQQRCRQCITSHQEVRDLISKSPQNDVFSQFAREMLAYMSTPHHYDHKLEHRPYLEEQQRLAYALVDSKGEKGSDKFEEAFHQQSKEKKPNPIRDISSGFVDLSHRSDDIESLNKVIIPHTEQDRGRTNPSEKIQSVDRSERKGEDIELTERVEAKNKASKNAENIRDLIEDAIVKEKARQREEWLEELTNVDELIYED